MKLTKSSLEKSSCVSTLYTAFGYQSIRQTLHIALPCDPNSVHGYACTRYRSLVGTDEENIVTNPARLYFCLGSPKCTFFFPLTDNAVAEHSPQQQPRVVA